MAEADAAGGKYDVAVTVGAVADPASAEKAAAKELDAMQKRLAKVGTDEAKELAKQIRVVMSGLRDGSVTAKDVEPVAAAFAKIGKDAELSDDAISDMARKLGDAKDKSRNLSDHMRKAADSGKRWAEHAERLKEAQKEAEEASKRNLGNLEDSLRDISPEASGIADTFGKWFNRLPGAQGILDKMGPSVLKIKIGFLAVAGAILGAIKTMQNFQSAMRRVEERRLQEKGDDAVNDQSNATARLDLENRKRTEKYEHDKAMREAEASIRKSEAEADYARQWEKDVWNEDAAAREFEDLKHRKRMADEERLLARENMDAEIAENEAAKKALEEKKRIDGERLKAEQERLEAMENFNREYEAARSEVEKKAEEAANSTGYLRDSNAWKEAYENGLSEFGSKLDVQMSDVGKKAMKYLGLAELSPEEAQSKWEQNRTSLRQQRQTVKELQQGIRGLDQDIAQATDKATLLGRQSEALVKQGELATREYELAKTKMSAQAQRQIQGKMTESMAEGNRLTAMGLGGGNAAADVGRDIANNTRQTAEILREIAKRPLVSNTRTLGGRNDGIAVAGTVARHPDMTPLWGM